VSPDETALDLEWVAVLDRLEAATAPVARHGAEDGHGAADGHGADDGHGDGGAPATSAAWTPPVHLEPVPAHLMARAEGVLASQRAALDRVEAERRAVLGQLGALRAVGETAAPSRPVYLDASA